MCNTLAKKEKILYKLQSAPTGLVVGSGKEVAKEWKN